MPANLIHLGPLLDVFGDELAVLGGRTCKRCVAKVRNPRFHRGIGECGIDLLIERRDDVGGRVLWRADTQQYTRIVTRQKIGQGWDVRQRRRARCRCDRQRAQLAGSDQLDRRRKGVEYNLDPTANQVSQRRRRTAIRHPYHVDASHHHEQLAVHIQHAPATGRPHVDLAGIGFGIGNEFRNGFGRERRVHDHHARPAGYACHRRDVVDEIEVEIVVERCIDRIDRSDEEERIAIGQARVRPLRRQDCWRRRAGSRR